MPASLVLLTLLTVSLGGLPLGAADGGKAEKHRAAQTKFFAGPILTIHLELASEKLNELRRDPRRYVEASLRVGARTYPGVAVKLKGATGSFRPIDEKPCFTVHLGKSRGGERFHGLNKFHLNNGSEDPSMLRQLLCGEIARAGSVPAVRCTHAFVQLNQRDLGLYVLTESYTEDFLAQFFTDTSGDLYEGGFCTDIDKGLTKQVGDPQDRRAIEQLLAACRVEAPAARWQQLGAILDVDRFASFLAMESLLGVGDGYDFFRNNYRIYLDPQTKRLAFILHGMDQPLSEAGFPVQKRPESMVGRAFVSSPEGRRLYRERAGALYAKAFAARDWPARVTEAYQKVQAAMVARSGKEDPKLVAPVEALRNIVRERVAAIPTQLGDK
jgi:spore coat protein H